MKPTTAWAIGVAAFALAIAVACYVTKSGLPLFAILLTPSLKAE